MRIAIRQIVATTEAMEQFWRHAQGWAPADTARLLVSARLDRQVSFTHTLSDYLDQFPPEETEARQILGYVTLRSLCEGVLKLFFVIWLRDYRRNENSVENRKDRLESPAKVKFHELIKIYSKNVDPQHEVYLRRVQKRGNCIHHFGDCNIGSQDELVTDILRFCDFLVAVNNRLPYPDDGDAYDPSLAL